MRIVARMQRQESKNMNVENKNQKVVFLLNGDTKKIAEENLYRARMALKAVGLSLRLAMENKSTHRTGVYDTLYVANSLLNEGVLFGISQDGFCCGGCLEIVSARVNFAYDTWFKRGSRKTKRYILDAMKHLLDFAKLAGVDFCYLDLTKIKHKEGEKEFEAKAAI